MTEVSTTDNVPFALKFLVYFMGILLVVGTIALIVMMVFRTGNDNEGEIASEEAVVPVVGSAGEDVALSTLPGAFALTLPNHVVVKSTAYSDGMLTIHICGDDGSSLVLFDVKKQKVTNHIAIRPSSGCSAGAQ